MSLDKLNDIEVCEKDIKKAIAKIKKYPLFSDKNLNLVSIDNNPHEKEKYFIKNIHRLESGARLIFETREQQSIVDLILKAEYDFFYEPSGYFDEEWEEVLDGNFFHLGGVDNFSVTMRFNKKYEDDIKIEIIRQLLEEFNKGIKSFSSLIFDDTGLLKKINMRCKNNNCFNGIPKVEYSRGRNIRVYSDLILDLIDGKEIKIPTIRDLDEVNPYSLYPLANDISNIMKKEIEKSLFENFNQFRKACAEYYSLYHASEFPEELYTDKKNNILIIPKTIEQDGHEINTISAIEAKRKLFDLMRQKKIYLINYLKDYLKLDSSSTVLECCSAGDLSGAMVFDKGCYISLDIDRDMFKNSINFIPEAVFSHYGYERPLGECDDDDWNLAHNMNYTRNCLPNFNPVISNALKLPFADGTFDLCIIQGRKMPSTAFPGYLRSIKKNGYILSIKEVEEGKEDPMDQIYLNNPNFIGMELTTDVKEFKKFKYLFKSEKEEAIHGYKIMLFQPNNNNEI